MLTLSRPHFWIYLFGPYLIGTLAGSASVFESSHFGGQHILDFLQSWGAQLVNPRGLLLLTLYFLYPANLLIYGVNDLFDYETDTLNDKKKSYEQVLEPRKHRSVARLILSIHLVFAVLFVMQYALSGLNRETLVALITSLVLFVFFGVFYSATPIRAKAIPFADGLFNVLYIMPGLVGLYASGGTLSDTAWPALIAACLRAIAMHCYSAVPDITADSDAGIRTTAVLLGKTASLIYCAILYSLSAILVYPYLGPLAILGGLVYGILIILSLTRKNIFGLYRIFPYINTMMGFCIFVRLVLHV